MTLSSIFLFFDWLPDWLDSWLNYPGLEAWKFFNLLVFIGAAFYLHHRFGRPIREALRARREGIRRELQRAREERDQALAKLAEVEARFANLDAEVAKVKEKDDGGGCRRAAANQRGHGGRDCQNQRAGEEGNRERRQGSEA